MSSCQVSKHGLPVIIRHISRWQFHAYPKTQVPLLASTFTVHSFDYLFYKLLLICAKKNWFVALFDSKFKRGTQWAVIDMHNVSAISLTIQRFSRTILSSSFWSYKLSNCTTFKVSSIQLGFNLSKCKNVIGTWYKTTDIYEILNSNQHPKWLKTLQ